MTATFRLTGPSAEADGEALRAALVAEHGADAAGEVQIHVMKGDVIAVVGLAFGAVGAADTLWKWWQARQNSNVEVRIETSSGDVIEVRGTSFQAVKDFLANVDEDQQTRRANR